MTKVIDDSKVVEEKTLSCLKEIIDWIWTLPSYKEKIEEAIKLETGVKLLLDFYDKGQVLEEAMSEETEDLD